MREAYLGAADGGVRQAMLEIADLVTAYGKIEALKGVSLSANRGRITCLLGPNGAGKTTLMMTVAGILKPRRGSIRFDGRRARRPRAARIVARGVALVPENRLVFPQMSVRENLLAGAYQRSDKAEVAADIERMYTRFPRSEGARASSWPERSRAASSRCSRWRAR